MAWCSGPCRSLSRPAGCRWKATNSNDSICGQEMSALFDLSGRTALITGAGRGLGFAYAEGLAAAGAAVVINDLREENMKDALGRLQAKGCNVRGLAFDV